MNSIEFTVDIRSVYVIYFAMNTDIHSKMKSKKIFGYLKYGNA